MKNYSFALTISADHDSKETTMTLYDYGKEIARVRYDVKKHCDILVSIGNMFGVNYVPYHDVYEISEPIVSKEWWDYLEMEYGTL